MNYTDNSEEKNKSLNYKLADLFIKISENFYIKASQFYFYVKYQKYEGDNIKILIPTLRYFYAAKKSKEGYVSSRLTDKFPEQVRNDSIANFDFFNINDEELSEFDFLEITKEFYLQNIKKGKNISIREPELEMNFSLFFCDDIYYNPYTGKLEIPDKLPVGGSAK